MGRPVEKRYYAGTHRTRSPAETLAVVQPLLAGCGITRVADITGLDRIGIPVFMAIRPNSRSLAASQGKGLDRLAAKASAVMEAIELYQAEHVARPIRLQSHAELSRSLPVADPAALPGIRGSLFRPHWPIPWIEGVELGSGDPLWVPYELVHADTTVPPMPGSGCFDRGTNGLASGNTLAEAVLHGLCEVIERDALALWEHQPEDVRDRRRLALDAVGAAAVTGLVRKFAEAGVHAVVWDVTSDVGVAAYRTVIFDATTDPLLNPVGAAFGAGCHPDPVVALVRSLTEAAQSRLTAIAGSRDDLKAGYYGPEQAARALERYRRLADAAPPGARFEEAESLATPTAEGDVAVVLSRLRDAGLTVAVAVDLSEPGCGVHVVRVVVPGLEGPTESPVYRAGARVRALAGR
ncbi:YcaO-like family protein [Actinoplanes sp. NEAU-A11]|uniref:YcaO-like family protein n=1 Tax=Actinoplanes aureus TaxID=2792083 RepID=A0A931CGE2_9ACTN|nr:YcaO-like family protein [Actinoplanes aureus]